MRLPELNVERDATREDTPTSVYRYYDRFGQLLYVGITKRGTQRNNEHNEKVWWPFVARQEVEHYGSRTQALARETDLIRHAAPPFNKQQNPHHKTLTAEYLKLVATEAVDLRPHERWMLMDRRVPLLRYEERALEHGFEYGYRTLLEHRQICGSLIFQKELPRRVCNDFPALLVGLEAGGGVAFLRLRCRHPLPDGPAHARIKYITQKPQHFALASVVLDVRATGSL